MANYLGLDVGTSSIKAIVLDTDTGKICSNSKTETPIHYFDPQHAEHDPESLVQAVFNCIQQAAKGLKINGLGISCFAEAGLPLDQSGKALFPIIAWFDQRSEPQVQQFLQIFPEEDLENITGQKAAFSFALFKLLWIKQNHPEIFNQTHLWLSASDYLLFRMTGEYATDFTQASRTMLFDQKQRDWSERILTSIGINRTMLPKAVPSGTVIGGLTAETARMTGLPQGLPCCTGGHDHLCGAFASGGHDPKDVIDSSGSSEAIIQITSHYDPNKALFSNGFVHYHHVAPQRYVIKGGLKASGRAFLWLTEILHLTSISSLERIIQSRYKSTEKIPLILPFFQGSGTPNRHPFAQGAILGLDLSQSPENVLLAFYEGLGFWLKENINTLIELTNISPHSIIAIGGGNQNQDFLQVKSNINQLPISVPEIPEPSAVGAALLAGLGCGTYIDAQEAQESLAYSKKLIEPEVANAEFYNHIYREVYLPAKKISLESFSLLNH
jgi:xylulokinase